MVPVTRSSASASSGRACRAVTVPFMHKVDRSVRGRAVGRDALLRGRGRQGARRAGGRDGALRGVVRRRSRSARGGCLSGGGRASSTSSPTSTSSGGAAASAARSTSRQISYALIRWNASDPVAGRPRHRPRRADGRAAADALAHAPRRRRARSPLGDHPRRRAEPLPSAAATRPLAQRLDPGERVLWSGSPQASAWTARRAATAAVGGVLALLFVRSLARSVPSLARVLRLHALPPALAAVLVGRGGARDAAPARRGRRRRRTSRPAAGAARAGHALLRDQRARAHPPRQRGALTRPLAHRVRHRRAAGRSSTTSSSCSTVRRRARMAPSGAFGTRGARTTRSGPSSPRSPTPRRWGRSSRGPRDGGPGSPAQSANGNRCADARLAAATVIGIGSIVNGKYRLVAPARRRRHGRGLRGAPRRARHARRHQGAPPRARARPGLVERFLQEARVAAQIRSPHVVQVTDVDRTPEGDAYIVMELLEGEPLSARARARSASSRWRRRASSRCRSSRRSRPRTRSASCTATSSPRTCSSRSRQASRW